MKLFFLSLLFLLNGDHIDMTYLTKKTYSYLALGDSYTIGEGVLITESFPYQVVQQLRKDGLPFMPPEIIARTGWTTDELQAAIDKHTFLPAYDIVTLLIGVNNQYRGRSASDYQPEFEKLLQQAIAFAGGNAGGVIVVSIPDWAVTPFARERLPDNKGRDKKIVSAEIDSYNKINREISLKYKVNYTDITPGTREAENDPTLVAQDGLHPSAKEYSRWAEKLNAIIKPVLNKR